MNYEVYNDRREGMARIRNREQLRDLLRKARRNGCTVERTRNGHYRIKTPTGATIFAPSTPSEYRGLLNLRAQIRRAGVYIQ